MTITGRRRKVQQFTTCKGVFQGGGCKGFAYVGAYKAAIDAGVVFTEVCGTSAGSIFAAFIAAGATPEQMRKIVSRMDADALFHIPWYSKWKLIFFTILLRGYVINPKNLEKILNAELAALLHINGEVKFRHLRLPLTVVASDLCKHTYVVFSSERTPDESVAHAVVCSSAFTYFFKVQDKRYTDGGLVSNMPTFALKANNHFDKILAFQLLSKDSVEVKPFCFMNILNNVINTITNANVEVQSRLVPKCYVVPIDVKEYEALEFKKISNKKWLDSLIEQGEISTKAFFESKQKPSLESTAHEDMLNKSVEMRTQLSLISLNEDHDLTHIRIIARNTIWARELFPLLVGWYNEGIHVDVYCEAPRSSEQTNEDARRRMLRYMGCEVFEVQASLPLIGYFVKRRNDRWEAIISSDNSEKGKYYHLAVDKPLITTAFKSITDNVPSLGVPLNPLGGKINLLPVASNVILNRIKNDPLYVGATLSYETISLKNVMFLTQYVLNYKYINIELIYNLYQDAGLEPFSAATIVMGQKDSLVGPPVLEEHQGVLYVIEGNTRCFYSIRENKETMEAVVVRNVVAPLPTSGRFKFEDIILTDNTLTFNSRYRNPNGRFFRHVERCLRPSATYLI
jgi:predicted acylesterase/phospholipase RssA